MASIYFWRDGQRIGTTSQAFDIVRHIELMRENTLAFSVANSNPARQLVAPGVVLECEGQKYDIDGFVQSSGQGNITDVTASHVSCRLNKYVLPPLYSHLGTIAEIVQDILNTAVDGNGTPAASEFAVGDCADLGTMAFALGNEQEVSTRSAFLGMQAVGVEVDYDNFTVNMPVRIGSENAHTFRFDKDLVSLRRTWNKNDGITYEASVAALYRAPGHESETFALGDTVTVQDDLIGDTFQRRIVAYDRDAVNPANDRITLGVFVRDSATNAVKMQAQIDAKLTEGEVYNGNRITRTEGFVSETNDGAMKTTMSGDQGLALWAKEGDTWVWIGGMKNIGGKVYNVSGALTNPEGDGTYATIGRSPDGEGGYGLSVVSSRDNVFFRAVAPAPSGGIMTALWASAPMAVVHKFTSTLHNVEYDYLTAWDTGTVLSSPGVSGGKSSIVVSDDGIYFTVNGEMTGWSGDIAGAHYENGLCTGPV